MELGRNQVERVAQKVATMSDVVYMLAYSADTIYLCLSYCSSLKVTGSL
jgi:hypothetical protein